MTNRKAGATPANNFNLIRLLAAWLVLFSRAYQLSGAGAAEPLLMLTSGKMTLGTLSVGIFFSISGYLITGSAYAHNSFRSFFYARIRRIFPALAVVLVLSAFVLGPLMTTLDTTHYFSHIALLTYVWRNLSLFHLQYDLPGVFGTTPYGAVVNGSLWTMPIEFALYLATGASVVLRLIGWQQRILIPLLVVGATSSVCWFLVLDGSTSGAVLLIPYFMLGAACRLAHRWFEFKGEMAVSLLILAMLGVLADWKIFPILASCAISYGTLWLACHRTWIVPFNTARIGDLSYGIYLFAFPVQQTVLALGLAHTPETLTLVATLVVLPLAWATWHGVERRFVHTGRVIDTPIAVAACATARQPGALLCIASMSLARAYGVLLSLTTLFISARLLGPDGRGEFAAAMAWASLLATLFNLSLGQALQHRLQSAVVKPSIAQQVGTLGALGCVLSIMALLSAVGLFAASGRTLFKGISNWSLMIAFSCVPLLVWEQYASNLLAATAQTALLNRAQYWGRSVGFLVFLLFVLMLGWGVAGAIASQLSGQLLVAAMLGLSLWRLAGNAVSWSARDVMPLLHSGALIHLTTVAAFLLDQVSILLISHYLAKHDVGFYQLAQQMVGLFLIIPQSALLVIYGSLASSTVNAIWPRQRRLASYVMACMAGMVLLAWLLAPLIVGLIAGYAFEASMTMFRALLPTLLGLSLSLLMTPQWIGRGMLKLNTFLTIATSVVVVGASAWAIPRYGVDGAIKVRLAVYALWVPAVQGVFWVWCNRCARGLTEEKNDAEKVRSV